MADVKVLIDSADCADEAGSSKPGWVVVYSMEFNEQGQYTKSETYRQWDADPKLVLFDNGLTSRDMTPENAHTFGKTGVYFPRHSLRHMKTEGVH